MNDTEQLIKAALAKQAGRAPHPGPIVHALRKPRRRPWRTLSLVVATMLLTGGIAVPLALQSSPDQPAPPPAPPPTARDLATGVPMAYMLTYLPPGYVETGRTTNESGDSQVRTWTKGKAAVYLGALGPNHPDQPKCLTIPSGERSTGKGVPIHFTWNKDGWCLQVTADASVPEAERRKIVESVMPDEMSVVRSPVRFRSLPSFLNAEFIDISSGPKVRVRVIDGHRVDKRSIEVTVAPKRDLEEAPETIRHLVTDRDLGDGRSMRMHFSGGPEHFPQQLREQILNDTEVVPADLSWYGR